MNGDNICFVIIINYSHKIDSPCSRFQYYDTEKEKVLSIRVQDNIYVHIFIGYYDTYFQ